jgi:hypothetical protein
MSAVQPYWEAVSLVQLAAPVGAARILSPENCKRQAFEGHGRTMRAPAYWMPTIVVMHVAATIHADALRDFVAVSNGKQLQGAVRAKARHIVINNHMDLTDIPREENTFTMSDGVLVIKEQAFPEAPELAGQWTRSVRVRTLRGQPWQPTAPRHMAGKLLTIALLAALESPTDLPMLSAQPTCTANPQLEQAVDQAWATLSHISHAHTAGKVCACNRGA